MPPGTSKKTSCAFNTFIQSLPLAWLLLTPWKETIIITVPDPGKDPKFPPKFTSDQPLGHCGQTEKLIFRTIQKHIEERNSLNAL
jgi:hypothetical protein